MGLIDAFWHIANLLAPALGMALVAPTVAKLIWRQELRSLPWWGLVFWVFVAGAAVLLGGLLLLGQDGRMATYAALVGVSAFTLWWCGWR